MLKTCFVVMQNEHIHVYTKESKGLNFQLLIPH